MSEKTKEEGPNENAIRWILNIWWCFKKYADIK